MSRKAIKRVVRKAGETEKHSGKKFVTFVSNGLSRSLGKNKEEHVVREDVAEMFFNKGYGKTKK